MKKVTVIILMVCYLAVTAGVVINFHYCMDRLASAKLFEKKAKECGKCGMHTEDSNGCCRDEVKVVKMEDDQQVTVDFSYSLPTIEALTHETSEFIIASFYNVPVTRHYQNHSPPLLPAQDTYLQNSVFRI
ncbi:MAG: hypothetical protein H7Y01_13695 [Ferruginibacter sp.]|nr:hypothetical protein [Chitinophagaceae bacterium]